VARLLLTEMATMTTTAEADVTEYAAYIAAEMTIEMTTTVAARVLAAAAIVEHRRAPS
jgi:hypothetical protein